MKFFSLLWLTLAGIAFSTAASAATIDLLPGDLSSGKIFTPCIFDGVEQRCFLDSGSDTSNVLNFDRFSSYPSLAKLVQFGASGTPQVCDWILLQKITVADLTLLQHQVGRCSGSHPGNVIGIDIFQGKTLRLDFKSFSLDANDTPIPTTLNRNRFSFAPGGLILLPVTAGTANEQAVWDTGAGLSSVDQTFARSHPDLFTFIQDINGGTDSAGNPVKLELYMMKSLVLGGRNFNALTVLAFDFSAAKDGIGTATNFILGYNVIAQANWYLDLRTRSWSIY